MFAPLQKEALLRGYPAPALDLDFVNGVYHQDAVGSNSAATNFITTSRASSGYADDTAGVWTSFLSNVPRITNKGLLVEEARTNVALWCRDLTNAAWTRSNITAALDQTGIDGTSNSASRLTATAGNGTVKQAITLASSARFQSAFVKRLTGTGTINMTMDNGTTWTAVVPTSTWTRLTIPTQTLANPTVGFQIVTSGDAIAVDFVQNENSGFFATSPIPTTTVAATRAADAVTVTTLPMFGTAYSLFGKGVPNAPDTYATNQWLCQIDNGTGNERVGIRRNVTTNAFGAVLTHSAADTFAARTTLAWVKSASGIGAAAFAANDQQAYFNGSAVPMTIGPAASMPSSPTTVRVGGNNLGQYFNGTIERFALWPTTRLSSADLQRITT